VKLHKPVVFIANIFKIFHGILYGDIALRNKFATEITVICSIIVIEPSIHLHKVHCTNIRFMHINFFEFLKCYSYGYQLTRSKI